MAQMASDALSELLMARMLEEDLRNIASAQEAERLQLDLVFAHSARSKGRIAKYSRPPPKDDADLALEILALDARLSGDAAYAQSLQLADDAAVIANQQAAMKLEAAERKAMLDAEFARRLQAVDEQGLDTDDPRMKDAETLLGRDAVERIMASDPNIKGKRIKRELSPELKGPQIKRIKREPSAESEHFDLNNKGKGKGPQIKREPSVDIKDDEEENTNPVPLYPTCGICMESFQITHSPIAAARSANSSSRLPFGLRLPCTSGHGYCIACLSSYIQSKIDPEGEGVGSTEAKVFPIRCPECPITEWVDGIQDDVAARVLGEKGMLLWHHQKLLDTIPRYYCPNPRCSSLVQLPEDEDESQAICPSCTTLICVPCRVIWHSNLTCEEYQALPPDERSPEDQLVIQLAKAKNWRRCPDCSAIVELAVGCNHITCRCGTHFCFKCGSRWDRQQGRCTRIPQCVLWDEDMLLEEREREREARQRPIYQPPVGRALVYHNLAADPPPPPYGEAMAVARHHDWNNLLGWMVDPAIVCTRHWFTTEMLRDLSCGYCNVRLNSIADMQYHLAQTRRHPVYACCGRFFKREEDYGRHIQSYPKRFAEHVHQVHRNYY